MQRQGVNLALLVLPASAQRTAKAKTNTNEKYKKGRLAVSS